MPRAAPHSRVVSPIGCRRGPASSTLAPAPAACSASSHRSSAARQDWLLVDADAALLDEAFGRTAGLGTAPRLCRHVVRRCAVTGSTPRGLWRMQTRSAILRRARELAATLLPVRCRCRGVQRAARSGFRVHGSIALITQLAVPFLACLTVDGRDTWLPRHPHDARVRTAFRRDQRQDKGFGPALGAAACGFALARSRSARLHHCVRAERLAHPAHRARHAARLDRRARRAAIATLAGSGGCARHCAAGLP